MEEILDMTAKIPVPTISPTITGSASNSLSLQRLVSCNRAATRSTLSASLAPIPMSISSPGHPIPHRVFEHATKAGYIVMTLSILRQQQTLWVIFAAFIIITLIFTLMTIRIEKVLHTYSWLKTAPLTLSLHYNLDHFNHWIILLHYGSRQWVLIPSCQRNLSRQTLNGAHIPPIYWARYIDWAITFPLILLDLTTLADLPGVEILLAIFAVIPMMLFVRSLCLRFMI